MKRVIVFAVRYCIKERLNTLKARTAALYLSSQVQQVTLCILNDALNIDVTLFCREIVAGAREWLDSVEGTERFKANYAKFVRHYPNGLAPYIVGVPVIG